MIPTDMLIYGIALPIVSSAVVYVLLAMPWRSQRAPATRRMARAHDIAGPFAIGGGYLTGTVGLYGSPRLISFEAWHWLFHLCMGAMVLAVIVALTRLPEWLGRGLAWILLAFAPCVLVWPLLSSEQSTTRRALLIVV